MDDLEVRIKDLPKSVPKNVFNFLIFNSQLKKNCNTFPKINNRLSHTPRLLEAIHVVRTTKNG